MRAIYVSVRVASVRSALSHGDLLKFNYYYYYYNSAFKTQWQVNYFIPSTAFTTLPSKTPALLG